MIVLAFDEFNRKYRPIGRGDEEVTLWQDYAEIEGAYNTVQTAISLNKIWTVYSNTAGIIMAKPGTMLINGIALMFTENACKKDVLVRLDVEDYGDAECNDCLLPMKVVAVEEHVEGSPWTRSEDEIHVVFECENCNQQTHRVMSTLTWEIIHEE